MTSVRVMVNSYFFQLVPSQVVLFNWSTRTDVNSYLKSTRTFFWSTRTFEIIIYLTNMISYDVLHFIVPFLEKRCNHKHYMHDVFML